MSDNKMIDKFDLENFAYKVKGKVFKLKEMTASEFEKLQDKDVQITDKRNNGELSSKDILTLIREWDDYILQNCFAEEINKDELKDSISISEYKAMIMEVPVFLLTVGDKDGAKEYMKRSTETRS